MLSFRRSRYFSMKSGSSGDLPHGLMLGTWVLEAWLGFTGTQAGVCSVIDSLWRWVIVRR